MAEIQIRSIVAEEKPYIVTPSEMALHDKVYRLDGMLKLPDNFEDLNPAVVPMFNCEMVGVVVDMTKHDVHLSNPFNKRVVSMPVSSVTRLIVVRNYMYSVETSDGIQNKYTEHQTHRQKFPETYAETV